MSDELCPGSGQRSADLIIMDIGPWAPQVQCAVCHGRYTSVGGVKYLLPDHKTPVGHAEKVNP